MVVILNLIGGSATESNTKINIFVFIFVYPKKKNFKMKGDSPLMIAARRGQTHIVEWLLEHGADPDHKNVCENALTAAIEKNHTDTLKILVKYADLDQQVCFKNRTVAMFAVKNGRFECLKILVDAGADLKITDHGNENVLHLCVKNCRGNDMLKFLIDSGAEVNTRSIFGTPVSRALKMSNKTAVNLLIEAGADINLEKITPLEIMSERRGISLDRFLSVLESWNLK